MEKLKNNIKREEEKGKYKERKIQRKTMGKNVTIIKTISEMIAQMQYYLHKLCY